MAIIKKDKHGLYIATQGFVFRPVISKTYEKEYPSKTTLAENTVVFVNHLKGTPLAIIKTGKKEERWHSHGPYIDTLGNVANSESHFKPSYYNWGNKK